MVVRRLLQVGFVGAVIGAVVLASRQDRNLVPSQAAMTPTVSLPLMFEPSPDAASLLARSRGYAMHLTSAGATFLVAERRVTLDFVGGAGTLQPERPLPTRINYFRGSADEWRIGIQPFAAARIEGLYQGIDAVFYGSHGDVEYDLVVAPGARVDQIRMRFAGADRVEMYKETIRLQTGTRTLTQQAPVAYQQIANRRVPVGARYVMDGDGTVRLAVAAYDTRHPLVIDPTITYATYFGATGHDLVQTLATDASGSVYLAGSTQGTDFLQVPPNGNGPFSDGYTAKLRADGSVEWLSIIGGAEPDGVSAIAVAPTGDVFLTGHTWSDDFPTTPGAYAAMGPDVCDTFVMRMGAGGSIAASTTLAAPQPWGTGCGGTGIAVDAQGRPNVVGSTASPTFVPTRGDSYGPVRPGLDQPDGYFARFTADLSRIEVSRLIAGSGYDYVAAAALDQYGNLYVAGRTTSSDFPTVNAIKPARMGPPADPDGLFGYDGFLTMVWDNGTIGFSTYLGGSGEDAMNAVAVGLYDRVYVAGTTNSPDASFYKPSAPGQYNGIIYHVIPKSTGLLGSRPIGGTGFTSLTGLTIGTDWHLWITGYTDGANWQQNGPDDPVPQRAAAGGYDLFLEKWGPDINTLIYSYLLGGAGHDRALAVALDPLGDIYVAGDSTSADFPVRHPLQPAKKDGSTVTDGFIAKLGCYLNAWLPVETQPATGGPGSFNAHATSGCAMRPVSNTDWLRVTGVDAGKVYFTADANPTASERQGTILLSGKKVVPILQAAGAPTGGTSTDEIVLNARDVTGMAGNWQLVPDAVHGSILAHPDRGQPKIETASANPAEWFTFTFNADAGKPYHLWIHGRAQDDSWRNDSIYVQFSDSVDAAGNPIYRIGTTSATWMSLEECSGCGEQGWGWQDNQYGTRGDLGPDIYFATSGPHTIKLQVREDGFQVGQVVLSAKAYLRTAPGGNINDPTIVTAGSPPPDPAPPPIDEIVLWAAYDAVSRSDPWQAKGDPTAAGQVAIWRPDLGFPKVEAPFADPASTVHIAFNAEAGKGYRLWLRMKADNDHWANDSVWVQFSGSVDASGNPVYRTGTTSGTWVSLEECSGCGEQGWGWQDNAYGSPGNLGPLIYFATSGPQTLRLQNREDGIAIDQIVLSAVRYATSAPGANRNDTTILPRTQQ